MAEQTFQTPVELVQQGLEEFLSLREALRLAVEEGRSGARRGDLVDHDAAMEMMDEVLQNG